MEELDKKISDDELVEIRQGLKEISEGKVVPLCDVEKLIDGGN